jgi:hypothetical protein
MDFPLTLTYGATTLDLDRDLRWVDDLTWSPVAQTKVRSITGAWIVDAMPRAGGKPITLQGGANDALLTRADLLILRAWLDIPEGVFTLQHQGQTYQVCFDHGDAEESQALAAEPYVPYSDPEAADYYCNVKLRFFVKD